MLITRCRFRPSTHPPLIEPDVRISRIRLSDLASTGEAHETRHRPQASSARRPFFLRLSTQLSLKDPEQAIRQSPFPRHLRKHTGTQGETAETRRSGRLVSPLIGANLSCLARSSCADLAP